MSPTVAPYGEWKSPISAEFITDSALIISDVFKNDKTGSLYWVELNGENNGRLTIMSRSVSGQQEDITPAPFEPKTRAHEYGGGAIAMDDDFLIACNYDDYCLYKIDLATKQATRLTPESNKLYRYADIDIHPSKKFLVCLREDHTNDTPKTVVNSLVIVRLDTTEPSVQVLAEGKDFYISPRFNPANHNEMGYVSWSHPFMPWDHTQVFHNTLEIADDSVKIIHQTQLAGFDEANEESAYQLRYSEDGTLYFISDRTGYWNLHKFKTGGEVELVLNEPMAADFMGPHWEFGQHSKQQSFAPLKSDCTKIAATYILNGVDHLALIDTKTKTMETIALDYTVINSIQATTEGTDDVLLMTVMSYDKPFQVITLNLRTKEIEIVVRSAMLDDTLAKYISKPEPITFKTTNDKDAYAFYYPPTNVDYVAPKGTLPPLRVFSHGGPTHAYQLDLDWTIHYFTSRGIAVLTVNYGGSTNYGREYRNRLRGQWGVVDVDDCCNAALHMVDRGIVDGDKLVIMGGSAGGYSTLACLAFRNVFKAGASYFGIGDLEGFAAETHKFESRYTDSLVGPLPAMREVYRARSPIHSADKVQVPCIFFQGLDDKIVTPNQAEAMVNALKNNAIPVAYLPFEGEGHGFQIPQNIHTALRSEISFYGRIFGFRPFDAIEVDIHNADTIPHRKEF
ncbi:Dipeptidyl aminopeptidase [Actinomortierella ambigua]|nr:Dipeptidyl aminopeptidase [Actinomortierella ambigua]